MLKTLLNNSIFQFLIGRGFGLYLLLVAATTRWSRINQAAATPFWTGKGRLITCFWHGRFPQAHLVWTYGKGATKAKMLVSRSREGETIAHTVRTLGVDVIHGSAAKGGQQKGGFEAVRELVRHIDDGGMIGVTPDGPRGPRMHARMGPVHIAKLAQAPLMAMAWSTRWRIVFMSWDRFILPLPFGSGVLIWSDPIAPPAPGSDDAAMEAVRLKLEQELNRISAEADLASGCAVIDPAPARAARQRESNTEPASIAS
jgi:lysophospholipid acyltransferase (LPLAT)-like uncharacterized protein